MFGMPVRGQRSEAGDLGGIISIPVRGHRDLKVWQQSKALAIAVYQHTKSFPKEELYGLTSQMRRCAVSVPSNIAEGNARSTKDYLRFIDIAQGSLAELETQLEIAQELSYLSSDALAECLISAFEVGRMLHGLSASLKSKLP